MITGIARRNLIFVGAILLMGVLLALAFWLRWQYVQTISLYVDEFTTLWAAQRTQEVGAPLMPSGVLYTRGLLATYVTALVGMVAGLDYTTGRLPSVLFGLATIAAIWVVGRRAWNARVGWLAALGLALLPEAIIWSGRARFYAQLQFFALLTIWAAFWAVQAALTPGDKSRVSLRNSAFGRHLLFAACFILALFSQEETILLYPSLVLGMVLWRGWRYLLHREIWPAQVVMLVGMAVRYAIEVLGQPGFFETIQAERPYVGLVFDVAATWPAYASLLIASDRLPWTLAGVLAIVAALVVLARGGWRPMHLERFHQATLFFALQFAFVLLFILTLVGGQWRETRYLFLVQPVWLLGGAAGAIWLIDRLLAREPSRWIATAALAVLVIWLGWQPATAVLERQVEGYDRAFAYVAAQRQPGDVVMTPQPPACAFVLGAPCDYYAVQRAYEEFVIAKDGVLVDRWSGATLLNDAGQLAEVIRAAPRVWLVTDAFRLATRYDGDFQRTVVEQFDPAFQERGVSALLAEGWRTLPVYTEEHVLDTPLAFGRLALSGWKAGVATPGQPLPVALTWQATAPIDRQLNTSLRLISAEGATVAQQDGPPARGIIPTNLFFDAPLPDLKTLDLPADLPAARYRLEVVVYDVENNAVEAGPLTIGWIEVG
ncbi:glycosyltransferase family 39 protein [Caldilinea sp.]|uniref:glycosyltransferase family 39 protein n=1 Tax=Caldilinea sp. TaxID=2293560 RepID=UPI002B5119EB|nr:glycosyltransferase family 39 protein [Caldilinea sp.]HRA65473.1 glycosyltransferase family 39 protein [Caldilinea sp.]